jgi:SAM-dependent methyltransferase
MAFSADEGKGLFKDWLTHLAKPLGFKRFLDVGCGAGVYGDIIREVFQRDVEIDAVEPFIVYVIRHGLTKKYDNIIVDDIRDAYPMIEKYDLIIAGDVLEHLTKAQAVEVVNGLLPKCRFFWGAMPVEMGRPWSYGYKQGSEEYVENPLNQHLHDWSGEEIQKEFSPMWLVPFVLTGSFLIEGGIR